MTAHTENSILPAQTNRREKTMASISIFVGTVYGGALLTARAVAQALQAAGHQVDLYEKPEFSDLTRNDHAILVCTSTTGAGELPPGLIPLYSRLRDEFPLQTGRPFGIITLGDSSYGTTFGAAGALMEELLLELGARPVQERLVIDAIDTTEPETLAVPWALEWVAKLT
jgi:flavodoxin